MILDVLDGGLLTTVQDAGRPGWTHLGVPVSGAADPWSRAVANLLAGNDEGEAALEMTLIGPRLRARTGGLIGLAGADLGGRVVGGRRLGVGRSHWVAAGDEIAFEGAGAGRRPGRGARCYLAVAGGIDVPVVLGSRSTCLAGGFGGLDGRAIRPGDQIAKTDAPDRGGPAEAELVWPAANPNGTGRDDGPVALRVLPSPDDGADALADGTWRVAAAADRVGVRLEGRALPAELGGETLTHGVPWGAIQIPPDGRPIILSADHQTTGGYRVAAVVISADLPLVGQLRPGDEVRFVVTDLAEADRAVRARHEALAAGAAALREAAGWDDLVASAGG